MNKNHNVLEVKSSMKKRGKYKEIQSDKRKYFYFYFRGEDTERLNNKLLNYKPGIQAHKVAHFLNYSTILSPLYYKVSTGNYRMAEITYSPFLTICLILVQWHIGDAK